MRSRHSLITISAVAALALLPLPAQDGLSEWEEKAALFETHFNPDSLAFYYRKITAHHRAQDSLAPWTYAWWDWQAAVFDDAPLALSLLDSALQQAWRAPANAHEAEALVWVQVNRGYHLFQLGKVLASVKAYEAAQQWLLQYPMPDFDALEYLYLPLGAHYTRLGDNEKARALYEQAIRQHTHGPEDGALAGLYNNLGLTFWNEGDYDNAVAAYRKGLACQEVAPVKSALLQLSLAQSLSAAGRYEEAGKYAETAIAGFRNILKTEPAAEGLYDYLSGAYATQAKLLWHRGNTRAAAAMLGEALAFAQTARGGAAHRDVAKIHVELGRLYLHQEDPRRALQAFHRALCSLVPGLPGDEAQALPAEDRLYEENTLFEALEGKADALWMQYGQEKSLEALHLALECHRLAGVVESRLRQLFQYESSQINLLAQSRRRAAKAIDIARALYLTSGDEEYLFHAWATAEAVKAVLLLDAVQKNRFRSSMGEEDPLAADERRLRQQIAYFERQLLLEPDSPLRTEWVTQLDELKSRLSETEQQLLKAHPAWAALRTQTEGFSAAKIRRFRQAMPEHAFIEYFIGDTAVEIFALGPDGKAVWQTTAQADSLGIQAEAFLFMLQSRTALQTPGPYREAAYALYQQLVQPVLESLGVPPRHLLIVPDAWLAFLPFEALYSEPAPDAAWEQAPFLMRRYGVQYAFSLAVWQSQREMPSRAKRNILQLAPRFETGQRNLSPLLRSAEEAPVSEMCRSSLHLDDRAGWETLSREAPGYRILHLSTHAGVDAGGGLPRVELYDRAAYLPDVYALPLQADLVVLSACQTALGQFRRGEGVMSLSRAFTYAGAKGLVAGLWSINEGATTTILGGMYGALRSGASKPEALRQAKIHYLDDVKIPAYEKSPYYWAALVYTGDEAPIAWYSCSLAIWRPAAFLALCLGMLLLLRLLWKKYASKRQPS